ncbi:MAG: hydroxyacid dehydrogenase [Tepidisphaeraceae bacterium]
MAISAASTGPRPKALLVADEISVQHIYGLDTLTALGGYVDFVGPPQSHDTISRSTELMRQIDILFTGWGPPVLDDRFLDAAPNLRIVLHGAGGMGSMLTPAVWKRGIRVTSANAINAIPVAEYCQSVIVFSLKWGWRLARAVRHLRSYPDRDRAPGCYRSTVGLVSFGAIARELTRRLTQMDLRVLVHDPHLDADTARRLGVTRVGLDKVFAESDVVSLHTPVLPQTYRMIRGRHIRLMKPNATFINTARGELVQERELVLAAAERPDLQFVLDTVDPEPPLPDSPLFTLPNVVLTPHIAGSVGPERLRMGEFIRDELRRYLAGEPLLGEVDESGSLNTTHQPVRRSSTESQGARDTKVEVRLHLPGPAHGKTVTS